MKILVTGSTGLIGKSLVPYLEDLGHEVRGINRKVTDDINDDGGGFYCSETKIYSLNSLSATGETFSILNHFEPDVIIHLAANSAGKAPDNSVERWEVFENNVKATMNLMEWARLRSYGPNCNVPKIIFASSIVIYNGNQTAYAPQSLYGVTKLTSEFLAASYIKEMGLDFRPVRLPAIVGPGLTHGVVKIFIDRLGEDVPFTALGPAPGSTKPYVHTEDVCRAFECIINCEVPNVAFDVSNNSISINKLAKVIMEKMGVDKEIVWQNANWATDNLLLQCERNPQIEYNLGYTQKYTSEEAIKKAVGENI